jgi:hypothetical protein
MPIWFPWIIIGGIVFMLLGFVSTKYQDRKVKPISFLQDFISGCILITFVGILAPDMLPHINVADTLHMDISSLLKNTDGDLLQVGPPPLHR